MDIHEIETFLTIVNTKNISKTAELLYLSQPTISHRLKMLESELNVKLIERDKGYKGISLTSKGEEFVPLAQRWLSLWKETQALQNKENHWFLSIGSTDSLMISLLLPLCKKVLLEDPLFDLRLRTHQSFEIYDLLSNYKIDIGFVYHHLAYKNIISEELYREKMYLVQPISTPLKKRAIHTDELNPEQELFFSWEDNYQVWHDHWIGSTIRPHIQIDTLALLNGIWNSSFMWMIAPYTIVKNLKQVYPVYVSEIINTPPDRIAYKVTNKDIKRNVISSIGRFEEMLWAFIIKNHLGLEESSNIL